MLRIAIILLILIMILVATYLPKFRRALGMTLMVLLGAIGFIIWQDTQEWELEFQRIPAAQAQLSHMQVRPGLNSRSFVVTGRLQNAAQSFTILSATLQATIEDCHLTECEIVGQEDVEILLEIPPNQARDFSITMPFPTIPKIIGEATWRYDILRVRAR
ncbi:MAG: hypothetical protein OEZ41_01265 [Nitrospirota bacterium]|nr:hypothetical protein [Nitrospirota bacterium]MDH5698574.1 hypothetical protein [Nitrospirota bacterium]